MRNKLMIVLAAFSLSACAHPHVSDPRFELPPAPSELKQAPPTLQTIDPNQTQNTTN